MTWFSHRENGIDFLSFRLWIGVWMALFLLTAVALDLSALIRYITRFTEESFAVLISVIFMYESVVNVADIWVTRPLRTGTAGATPGDMEQCYCSERNNLSTTATTDPDNRHLPASVTVQPNDNGLNRSLYRLIINALSRFRVTFIALLGEIALAQAISPIAI